MVVDPMIRTEPSPQFYICVNSGLTHCINIQLYNNLFFITTFQVVIVMTVK